MSETYKEQHPLLCDELSDEDYHIKGKSSPFQQRFRHTSGRARTHALGAAAIINHWPDHLSSLLMYWWIGLGMIAVMVFVIYNTIVTIAALPPSHVRPIKFQNPYANQIRTYNNSTAQPVYMHVFVARYDEFNINDHIPHVEIIAKKYENFKYNFIVVLNDMTQGMAHDLNIDEQNNEMALNSLWDDNENKVEKIDKFTVQYISFTKYMDNSPLKKYWRFVPPQFFGLLVRCVAIWDQGGVAFDPLLLNSDTRNSVDLKKIKDVFEDIQSTKSQMTSKRKKIVKKNKKKFNNIRDIINNLENTDESNNFPDNLVEAENKNNIIITNHDLNKEDKIKGKFSPKQPKMLKQLLSYQRYAIYNKTNSNMHDIKHNSVSLMETPESQNISQDENTPKQSLVPKLLDSLFNGRIKNLSLFFNNITGLYSKQLISTAPIEEKSINLIEHVKSNVTSTNIDDKSNLSEQIKPTTKDTTNNNKITTKLIIDLKGNLIATATSCHAFIGTIFSNILHHTDKETVSDFIIAELSIFCKGFLSSCSGVDIILL